jgi:hypothetical protein
MNASPVIRYPGGGSALWTDGSEASGVINAEFFGTPPADVVATVTGAQATARAGALVATGDAVAQATGAQANTAAGTLSAEGLAVALVTGASAQARAGTLRADGGAVPAQSFGGGPRRRDYPKFLGEIVTKPKLKIAAVARVTGAQAAAAPGQCAAFGAKSVAVSLKGAGCAGSVTEFKARGSARIEIKAPVQAKAGVQGAGAMARASEVKGTGHGFSDAEILAAVRLYTLAA